MSRRERRRWTISGVLGCAHVPLVSCGLVGWAHARVLCRVCVVCARRDPGVPPRGVIGDPRAPTRGGPRRVCVDSGERARVDWRLLYT